MRHRTTSLKAPVSYSRKRLKLLSRSRLNSIPLPAEISPSPTPVAPLNYAQIFFSFLGSFLGIAALAYLTAQSGYPLIAAPFGATAVLVFGVPESPLAQPRNVLLGNLIAAFVCVGLVQLCGTGPWVMALAVATAIKLMQMTRTVHPPGGAIALLGVMNNASWDFVLTPVLAGSLVIIGCTILFNNLVPNRPYPQKWF